MPASQLTQLKAALSSTGLNRKSFSKKEKKSFKKGGARETDRAKTLAKLEDIKKGLNKFDERETRVKHDVGGRNLKGIVGRPSAAKSAGLEARRKSLLPEHQLKHHRGTFSDRRFGESDPTLSMEDRMLERYTRERQRGQGKKGMFNLEDDDGEDPFGMDDEGLGGLTHGGRNVMDLPGDDFDAQGFGEEDEEEGKGAIGKREVARGHFGGFEQEEEDDQPERRKTKAEVMSEVIAKSKSHKYERQQQKELDSDIRNELDEDIDDLRALLTDAQPPVRPAAFPTVTRAELEAGKGDDDANYDQYVRELAFDARAKPKDRTKTEDELAVEEKERLEKAEANRLRRMRGEESEEDEDDGGRKKRKVVKRGDADDLDDDFEEDLLGPGIVTREEIERMGKEEDEDVSDEDDQEEDGADESDDENDDEDEDEDDQEEDDEEDDEEGASILDELDSDTDNLEDADGEEEDETALFKSSKARKKSAKGKSKEIPYTFPCPTSIDEFEEIIEEIDQDSIPVVVQRIRALHHPSLAQGNKEKLQDFLGVLLDYVLILASQPISNLLLVNVLHPHIVALVKLNPITAASHFTSKLSVMHKNLTRGLSRGASNPYAKTFPGLPELVFLRLLGLLWSTSDYSHPVVVPAVLLMNQYLSQSRIRSVQDLASGVFLCSLLAQYEAESKRLLPEPIVFLANTVLALLPRKKDASPSTSIPDHIAAGVQLRISVGGGDVEPSETINLPELLTGSSTSAQNKVDVLAAALRTIEIYAGLLAPSDAFIELFTPVLGILQGSRTAKLSEGIKKLHALVTSNLSRQISLATATRRPLALQTHKPIPIASHAPRFEDDFAPGRHYDPDVERNATQKLKSLYKNERKGAIKELRKDNRFLAGERAKEQAEKDREYNAKMRRVEGGINMERAEEKDMEREKAREKRRASRKS